MHHYLHHVSGLVSLESLCRDCLALHPDEQQCQDHEDLHQRVGDAFKCGRCAARFLREPDLARHLAEFHRPDRPRPAPDTAARSPGSQPRPRRGLLPLPQPPRPSRRAPVRAKSVLWCLRANCSESFESWAAFLQHDRATHEPPSLASKFHCTECLAVCHKKSQLAKHMARHDVLGDKFKCHQCMARFVRARGLKQHQDLFHARPS